MRSTYSNSIQIFTDGSVSPNSADFSFFISAFKVSSVSKLYAHASLFTTECYAIISSLQFIFFLESHSFLIISDLQSCLSSISSDSFNSSLSALVLIIESLMYHLSFVGKNINFFGCLAMLVSLVTSGQTT